jgi:hypothetical protein
LATASKKVPSRNERIEHSVFGLGTIVDMNDQHTTVEFDEAGTKKFVTSIFRFSRSDAPAPVKAPRRKKPAAKKQPG